MRKNIKKLLNKFHAIYYLLVFLLFKKAKFSKASNVFFFPYYHTGGAEKVHAQIVAALKDKKNVVIFTQGSAMQTFYNDFKNHAYVIELNPILNKKNAIVNAYLEKQIVLAINSSSRIQSVFACNSPYFYNLLPKLKTSLRRIDLFHAFEENDVRSIEVVKSAPFIDVRVVINSNAMQHIVSYYKQNGLSPIYTKKIIIIPNGIELSEDCLTGKQVAHTRIGFVGRWSEEKRPELFLKIALQINQKFPEIEFVMAGSGMLSNIAKIKAAGVHYLGNFSEQRKINDLYRSLSYVLLPSRYEGFPVVIMESMAFGVIPIATKVGGIADHITSNENGFLIETVNEVELVKDFCDVISRTYQDTNLSKQIAKNAVEYAHANFGIEQFNFSYQKLFNP